MRPVITFNDSCIKCGQCAAVCPTHHISMVDGSPLSHHNRRCLQCMHCSSACPQKAIHFEHIPAYAEYPETPEDETLKLKMDVNCLNVMVSRHMSKETLFLSLYYFTYSTQVVL